MGEIWHELDILLLFFFVGLGLTLFYDLMRLSRRIFPRGWLLTGMEDLLFWLLAALGFAIMCLWINDGIFRWYMMAASVLGSYLCLFVEKQVKFSFDLLKKRLRAGRK
jgi:hypothetical protein